MRMMACLTVWIGTTGFNLRRPSRSTLCKLLLNVFLYIYSQFDCGPHDLKRILVFSQKFVSFRLALARAIGCGVLAKVLPTLLALCTAWTGYCFTFCTHNLTWSCVLMTPYYNLACPLNVGYLGLHTDTHVCRMLLAV